MLAVTATAREADDLTAALGSFLPAGSVACFPGWETLPHERLSPQSETVGRRIAVLRRLAHPAEAGQPDGPLAVVVAPVRSLLQPIVAGLGDLEPVSLREGQACELDDLLTRLVEIGYSRADLVSARGEIAVRGGIVDVFPPTEEHPVRVEFFGDTIEEIRYFKVADQRSIGRADNGLWAPPCRELLLTPAVRDRAKELADTHPALADILGKLAEGIPVEGMEAFTPVLADRMDLLVDYVPPGGIVLACDPERIRARAEELVRTSQEFLEASWANAAFGAEAPIDLGPSAFQPIARIRAAAAALGLPWWTIAPFGVTDAEADEPARGAHPGSGIGQAGPGDRVPFRINASLSPAYRGDTDRMLTDVRGWLAEDWRVVLVTEGHGPAQRLAETLRSEGIGARLQDLDDAPEPGVPYVTTARIENGFVWPAVKLVLLTESDLAGHPAGLSSTKDMRRMPSRRRGGVDPLQLRAGDYVVHEQHGVGRYVEMTSRTAAGATREYLVIEYAPARRGQPPDRLYVPTDQLDEVTRYTGGEAPALHRLGGADWAKVKGRARKAVRQIASELIRLYSARMASPGFAFGPDTPWQRELEDAFPYVETPDQLAAIDEVKHDMERPVPMDRLISGDVGYGKTEIAVRAAFKAVQDGKQVAVLVPTTLLVQQHFSTFSERYAPFPVKVRPLSRFQSKAETDETLRGLADGTVDVVIGTHKLLQPETRFARLGLVIIDEEQRFGVEHKEYLKRLRTEVDVLAMSATPIPRTLEMGVAGIREMSTILTPPEERHPVLTFVGAYDARQVAAAIRRELLRDGQVFFVHNRVTSIRRVAAQVAELVPEARIAVAHGQMNEHELEQIMVDFWERKYDVLVATTIVESGPGHPQRQHAHHRPGRHVRPVPAAPAPRPGRPRHRAGLRLFPLPGRDVADRDRARTAGHRGPAHRGGRGHVRGPEGPGDPRRGQPARRRAVRAHRRGRVRPVPADDRRGGQRAEGRRPGGKARGPGGAAGQRAHPARLRARRTAQAGGLHPDRRHRLRGRRRRGPGRAVRPVRRTARAGPQPARGGAAARGGPAGRAHRHHRGGQPHQVRAGRAARFAAGAGAAPVPQDGAQARGAYDAHTGAEDCCHRRSAVAGY